MNDHLNPYASKSHIFIISHTDGENIGSFVPDEDDLWFWMGHDLRANVIKRQFGLSSVEVARSLVCLLASKEDDLIEISEEWSASNNCKELVGKKLIKLFKVDKEHKNYAVKVNYKKIVDSLFVDILFPGNPADPTINEKWKAKFKRDEIEQLKKMPYNNYLQSEHWRITRTKALLKYGERCLFCGSSKSLNVHHITYKRRGYERISDLSVICNSCHTRHHNNKKSSRKMR